MILTDTLELRLEIEEIRKKLQNQDKNIALVFSYLDELMTGKEDLNARKRIGFKISGSESNQKLLFSSQHIIMLKYFSKSILV